MSKILILGANGATAKIVTARLLVESDNDLTLYLRNTDRLSQYKDNPRVTLIDGDATDISKLSTSMAGIDIVYSNLGGTDLANYTKAIVTAMNIANVTRLIFYSALGSLYEVPGKFGEWNEQAIAAYLPGFRESAKFLTAHNEINTTQIRPAWLTDNNEISYETTGTDEPFKGTEISRQSVADFVVKLINNPALYPNESIGLNKPNTDGYKPVWM
ncbi:NAD-dependent dehydratase [Weissella paramesenteroides]|jgi:putative NADH-flavin reductase|uniref:NAD(P)H-binding protein n=1 Tax=Weissella paramesenteroides TaxID=1249 RepID=UPI00123B1E7A|nr:NAD(P)H-binding protein [Weissella paramesenteroides]KAA8440339.1 NAD-dependent dehydratase [Weissella paramesenteroides]KAA8440619.1 NAD-dependent dehydratase [Weissella paramesenteroides]KAA8440714.1 NAD-dependent dehydratase [Weissella paramesenteroides]KAA8445672.1 NAD-dependent dehydratase [Weissella paramesenteroides]KAA8448518.1 NAD-dependent dehydratase [Weissella paramesenteroides]